MSAKKPYVLGLTGSIGMGKTTTAKMFQAAGIPVWDADAAVHKLYQAGEKGAEAIARICPDALTPSGIDRAVLRKAIAVDRGLLGMIENLIHPLVRAHRQDFIKNTAADIVLCDIPLLFETGTDSEFDAIIVVTASVAIQQERVLARPGMTEASFLAILARQMPDAEKRAQADYIVDTSNGLEDAKAQVENVLRQVKEKRNA